VSSPKRIAPHIFCAIDFGEQGERAFFHALALAVAQNPHLTLLHIGPENRKEVPWEKYPGVRETLSRWRLLDDDASRADVSTKPGLSVKKNGDARQGPIQRAARLHTQTPQRPAVNGHRGKAWSVAPAPRLRGTSDIACH
jgi:hypothetical protein